MKILLYGCENMYFVKKLYQLYDFVMSCLKFTFEIRKM